MGKGRVLSGEGRISAVGMKFSWECKNCCISWGKGGGSPFYALELSIYILAMDAGEGRRGTYEKPAF